MGSALQHNGGGWARHRYTLEADQTPGLPGVHMLHARQLTTSGAPGWHLAHAVHMETVDANECEDAQGLILKRRVGAALRA